MSDTARSASRTPTERDSTLDDDTSTLDDVADDRFGPPGTQTLVETPPTASPLAALPERAFDNLLVVAARDRPSRIASQLDRAGYDPANVGVIPVAPGATSGDSDCWTTDSVQPADLTGIGMRFSDALEHVEPESGWVLVDSVGVLLTYADANRVCRFLRAMQGRLRGRDVRGVFCVASSAVESATFGTLRGMCDAERSVE